MPRRSLLSFLNSLAPPPDHVTDSTLIRRYLHERDHAAFELIVRRHADAVWSACLGILRNDADAEDAFQATFLALSRQAGSVKAEPTFVGWLYRVAVNAAIKRKQTRPALIERRTLPANDDERDSSERNEVQSIVHQELAALRDSDRLPLVLCDLEGRTREQAAGILGWPIGTVNGRLSRARERLKSRLIQRGVTTPAITIASIAASTSLSTRASAIALGLAEVPATISTLSTGALIAMSATKFKFSSALAAGIMLMIGTGTIIAVGQAPTPKPNQEKKEEQKEVVKKRKAVKMEDGRITMFPELLPNKVSYKAKDLQDKLGLLPYPPAAPLEEGLNRMRYEQLKEAEKTLIYNIMILESAAWDVTFLNQLSVDVDQLLKSAKQCQLSNKDTIEFARFRLLIAGFIENTVRERVEVAGTLRKQQLSEIVVNRYQCEIDLAELENSQAK